MRLQAPIPQLTDAILHRQLVYQTAEAEAPRHQRKKAGVLPIRCQPPHTMAPGAAEETAHSSLRRAFDSGITHSLAYRSAALGQLAQV